MTDKSLSLLDKIVNHTGKTARQLELIEELLKKQQATSTASTVSQAATSGATPVKVSQENAKAMGIVGKAITDISKAVMDYAVAPAKYKGDFINFVEKVIKVFSKKNLNPDLVTSFVTSLGDMGNSAALLSLGLSGFAKIKERDREAYLDFMESFINRVYKMQKRIVSIDKSKAIEKFQMMISGYNKAISSIKLENVEKGGRVLKNMAVSILGFSAAIVLGGTMLLASSVILAPVLAILYGLTKFYALIGKDSKRVEKASTAMKSVGISMIFLAGGVAALSLATMINPLGAVAGIGMIALAGLTYYVIGKGAAEIVKGSIAVGLMSLSMLIFTGAIWVWQKAKIDFMKDVLPMAGAVVVLGLTWALAGLAIELILPGAISVAAIGASAWVLGWGLEKLSKLSIDDKKIDSFSKLSWELIKVYSAAGLASVLILPGSLAMLGIGTSLLGIAAGVKAINAVDLNGFDPKKLSETILGIAGAFSVAGNTDGTKFNLLTFGTGIELGPNNIERGIKSVLKAGTALTSISHGLVDFNRLTQGMNFDSKDPDSMTSRIANVVGVIGMVFGSVGKSKNEGVSLWKAVFGNDWRKSDTEAGIKSVFDTGNALKSIAQGLTYFSDLRKAGIKDDDFDPNKKGSIVWNITKVVGAIGNAFGVIGRSKDEGESLFKAVFGNDWKQSDVEAGIASVKGVGKELSDIANALTSWKNLEKIGITDKDFQVNTSGGEIAPGTLMGNIAFILGITRSVFASIGKSEKDSNSWWNFDGGDVEAGIAAVKGSGKELTAIAQSLATFSKISTDRYATLKDDIVSFVVAVPTAFANVAQVVQGKESSIKAVSELLASTMTSLSKGMTSIVKNFEDTRFDRGYIGRLGWDITVLLTRLGKPETASIMNFGRFTSVIENLAKVVTPFEKFVNLFGTFSQDVKTFAENFASINILDFEKFGGGITGVSNPFATGFSFQNTILRPTLSNSGRQIFNSDRLNQPTTAKPAAKNQDNVAIAKEIGAEIVRALKAEKQAVQKSGPANIPQSSPVDVQLLAQAIAAAFAAIDVKVVPGNNQSWQNAIG